MSDDITPPNVKWLADAITTTLTTWTRGGEPVIDVRRDEVWYLALGLAYQSREFWLKSNSDEAGLFSEPDTRHPACISSWPDCHNGAYDPRCCRFPKACSCSV